MPEQANVFPDRFDFGRVFYNQARMSAEGIPQVSVVMGSCNGWGRCSVPAMSDETIMVRNQGNHFYWWSTAGESRNREKLRRKNLGGAEVLPAYRVADHLAERRCGRPQKLPDYCGRTSRSGETKTRYFADFEPLQQELYGFANRSEKADQCARHYRTIGGWKRVPGI